jgi:hypothetical protein
MRRAATRATWARGLVAIAALACATPTSAGAGAPPRYKPAESDAAMAVAVDSYVLDDVSREVPAKGKLTCPKEGLIEYGGTTVKLHKKVKMHAAFAERVAKFEEVLVEVATRVYGRKPSKIRHMGAYVCRRIKRFPTWLSEHSLGNALDVGSIEFPRASKAEKAAAPAGLAGSFTVSVEKHWEATKGTGAVHARFLRELADALIARSDIFRIMLGPSFPGHDNHLHLDAGFFRSIEF